jgi:hypothetical protein
VIAGAILIGLLALSIVPAVFSYFGRGRNAFFSGLVFLIALSLFASVQNPGRNMAVFMPLALAWIVLVLVIAGLGAAFGSFRRGRIAGQSES